MSSSSSSATALVSRSPSPLTPDVSDSLDPVFVQSDAEHTPSWIITSEATSKPWDESLFSLPQSKSDDEHILRLDDLIEPHAYNDTSPPCASSSQLSSPQPQAVQPRSQAAFLDAIHPGSPSGSLPVSTPGTAITLTKPAPPPATLPRKPDPTLQNNRIVHLAKESCLNFPLVFPSIPENGTKSRVETQVRVTVDLAVPSSFTEPYKYDRVGSWKWLKLPLGTTTKRRTRKQGKIDPARQDTLYLSATVTCATPPHNRVFSCTSCQTREAKRVAKKLAARVRPARSDSDFNDDPSRPHGRSKQHEDTTSIIQFNCAEVLDFSTGSAVLPLRITCYCRHHHEKVGFLVNMQMLDHVGQVVALGQTKPIMIMDDHKAAALHSKNVDHAGEANWSQLASSAYSGSGTDVRTSGKRAKKPVTAKRRPKPYDSKSKPLRPSREGSISSLPSPSAPYSQLPVTRSPTPSNPLSRFLSPDALVATCGTTTVSSCSSPRLETNINPDLDMFSVTDDPTCMQQNLEISQTAVSLNTTAAELPSLIVPHTIPLMFFESTGVPRAGVNHTPTIHRLIPNTGPTHGGIEVTVLGANFHANQQLNCIFGGVPASSTQRWSDNTLVCILPPRSAPGVVAVWIDKYQNEQVSATTSLFTYSDESDRTLMELALQVVGLKMTGKIEDAKDVAMRIVGSAGEDSAPQGGNNTPMMQLTTTHLASTREVLPLLLSHGRDMENFETLIVNCLALLDTTLDRKTSNSVQTIDAISHPSITGQTLLHYSAFLAFDSLTKFLISHNADVDARDRNGYTPLHFAGLSGSVKCAQVLLEAGADREIVNALGKTPAEIAQTNVCDLLRGGSSDSDDDYYSSDEDAAWGDGEEDADSQIPRRSMKRLSRSSKRGEFRKSSLANSPNTDNLATLSASDETQNRPQLMKGEKSGNNAKQTAWLTEVLQRTIAQLQGPQSIISNIPQLPRPHLPHLPDLCNVQWDTLPRMPVVFPVIVPIPGWPSFLQGYNNDNKEQNEESGKRASIGAVRAAQELRSILEKWIAMAAAAATNQQQGQNQQLADAPPPRYTPVDMRDAADSVPEVSSSAVTTTTPQATDEQAQLEVLNPTALLDIRPVDYRRVQLTDQEVNAYAYAPNMKRTHKLQKKHDRMLIVFWLPILFLSCIWAIYSIVIIAFQAVKTFLPLKSPIRG
ncbi:hypothetical protein APHAL10511_003665 [Amanita phalloides]|nr:hypothetical protein APHAL10511_003665 [Amanita phalloides]